MNYRGSYRHLLRNAKSALIAAIEIYNKPRFEYRNECFVILLLNAWELALKSLLSKNGKAIFYPKKRKAPYRTLSWSDALTAAESFLPKELSPLTLRRNLELLGTYRDNAVHFYSVGEFNSIIYALAQTNIMNFRDLLQKAFGVDLRGEIMWQLLPLGVELPIDPIQYISGEGSRSKNRAVLQFIGELMAATKEISKAGQDTGRLLTVFNVKLESVKKIGKADVVVGVEKAAGEGGPLAVIKNLDPNVTHPLRQKDIVPKVGTLHDKPFSEFVFQAIVWKYELKAKAQYCWQAKEGVLTKYSNDVVSFIGRLTKADLDAALTAC